MFALHLIAAIALIVALSHVLARLARRLGQPAVIGQLIAGIVLGPSLLGRLPGDLTHTVFPKAIMPDLKSVAQVALVLFLFAVGYELDRGVLKRRAGAVPAVAAATFVVPMLLGTGTALALVHWFAPLASSSVPRGAFTLFMAVALSITAVPVLAGIIREHHLGRTVPGVVAMAAAGVVDGVGWLALAAVLLEAKVGTQRAWPETLALVAAYAVVMVLAVRPALRWWLRGSHASCPFRVAAVVPVVGLSAWFTSWLGLHVILGAFLAGVVMPRREDGHPYRVLLRPLERAGGALIPVFFAFSGLSMNVGGLRGGDVVALLLVCAVAIVGKAGAGFVAARASKLGRHDSAVVGVLMNTRGLTELVVLNVGLQSGIIGERLYTILVLMALVTTTTAGPALLALAHRRRVSEVVPSAAQEAAEAA